MNIITPQQTRVAAYCRVSTNLAVQQASLDLQVESFDNYINSHEGWTLANIYADKGVSGTSSTARIEFNKMIKDAENGKIDYIIAKSISRFARNTVDALNFTRKLKSMGIGVYFEEQNLDTLSATSEIILTIQAAFAQEESHSLSENMKKGIRQRFAMGIPKWTEIFGFRCVDKEWIIEEKEAEVIRKIYDLFLRGKSQSEICEIVNSENAPAPKGHKEWNNCTMSRVLHNEKYIGDVEMQKGYNSDFIEKKWISNKDCKIEKYYKENHHDAIISREDFELVQYISLLKHKNRGCTQYPYYGFLTCPHCGENLVKCNLQIASRDNIWFCKNCRETRPFIVKEKNLNTAVIGALGIENSVEYYDLYKAVKNITFEKVNGIVDFTKMVITLKNNEFLEVKIKYSRNDNPTNIQNTVVDYINKISITDSEEVVPIVKIIK